MEGKHVPREKPATYLERIEDLLPILREHGGLGALLVDLTPLSHVELSYGSHAYAEVIDNATTLLLELSGNEVRGTDVFASNDRGGDGFLVFLSPPERGGAARLNELEALAHRVENYLNTSLARLASPYLHGRTRIVVGYSLVLQNPLMSPDRLLSRLVQDAWECVRLSRSGHHFRSRCLLQELLIHEELGTVYQPIVDMATSETMGFEALSRGPQGSEFQSPLDLFATAEEGNLAFELDRLCRQKALDNARGFPPESKLFVNVLPSSMYDPALQGDGLLRYLRDAGLEPRQLVFELTETYVIENYKLFGDAVRQFTELGINIGIDDIGAGYSGLERIAWLHPKYLKFDIGLIRHVDTSYVRREMVRALKALADKMGSTVVAEGIERPEERDTLLELGITYGQGFLLGRPAPPAWKDGIGSASLPAPAFASEDGRRLVQRR
jgi:EAL domain-containing protein (putative c-di-GMP-specific phosphodiesterase class I)